MHLADVLARLGAQGAAGQMREFPHVAGLARLQAVVFRLDVAAVIFLDIATAQDPGRADRLQALLDIDHDAVVGIDARRVIDAHRRLAGRRIQVNLAHRDADFRMDIPGHMDLAGRGQRARRYGERLASGSFGHCHRLQSPKSRAI